MATSARRDEVERAIRHDIELGRLTAGQRLPSERALAERFSVSRGTVVAALAALREEGWVDTRPASGSVVRLPALLDRQLSAWPPRDPEGRIDLATADLAAPADELSAALRAAAASFPVAARHTRYEGAGLPELRAHLAAWYTARGVPTTADQVLVTRGAMTSLDLVAGVLHRRQRRIAVEEPGFPGAFARMRWHSRQLVLVPVSSRDGWTDLSALSDPRVDLAYLMPEGHNPTGAVMPDAQREQVCAGGRRDGLTIVLDDSLADFHLAPVRRTPLRADGIVRIGSLAKLVGREVTVGWVRAPEQVVARLVRSDRLLGATPSLTEQLIAKHFFDEGMPHLPGRLARLRRQRGIVLRGLESLDRLAPEPNHAGLALWCCVDGDVDDLVATAARAGVSLMPRGAFSAIVATDPHLRIPYTQDPATLRAALAAVRRGMRGG